MSTDPTLDAVFLVELIALMLEGIVAKPCRYDVHVPYVWSNDAGRSVCGICHPPAR